MNRQDQARVIATATARVVRTARRLDASQTVHRSAQRRVETSEAAMTRALATLARAEAQLRQLRRPGRSK